MYNRFESPDFYNGGESDQTSTPTSVPSELDMDNDGKVSKYERDQYEQRAKNRRRMAWSSLVALVLTGFALMFLVPESRLTKLDGLLELYWVSLGGVVGAYVGISAWAAKKG